LFKRILVVIDPARNLEPAMDYVVQMVQRWDSSVVALYTAFEEAAPFKATYSGGVNPAKFVGKNAVRQFKRDLKKRVGPDVDFTAMIEEGPYEVVVPTVAAREEVDLLVLGSFHDKMKRRIVGSDTERMIEYSPCSVLLVRDPSKLPSEGSMIAFAHDSPKVSESFLKQLSQLARDLDCSVQPVLGFPQRGIEEGRTMAEVLQEALSNEGVKVEPSQVLTSRWILGHHGVVHRAVSGLMPSLVVVSRYSCDTACMGTHWLVHEFVADTPCPMLILKSEV
jgi:nucleotide-binding universal stress UspA family protein